MSVKLTELQGADERECLLMGDELESFGGAELSDEAQKRILSSVMGKAGFDMKDNITVKRRKINKRMIMLIAAAVLTSLWGVSVGAYREGYRFEDGRFIKLTEEEIIGAFGGEGAEEWLDSRGLNDRHNGENEHYDVSMYSLVSDGNYCQAYFCVEALDEAGMERLNSSIWEPDVRAYYADTGEKLDISNTSCWSEESLNDATHYYFALKMSLMNTDTSRDIELHIIPGMVNAKPEAEKLAEGLTIVFNAAANTETKLLATEDGKTLLLSPTGISQKYRPLEYHHSVIRDLKWIKSDGSIEPIDIEKWSGGTTGDTGDFSKEYPVLFELKFDGIIDISEIDGIIINNTHYYMDVNKIE